MTTANLPELKKLRRRQQMKLAEEPWFSGEDDSLSVSPVQKNISDERWTAYKTGKMTHITLSELERRLARS
jgi:hypothetical protein